MTLWQHNPLIEYGCWVSNYPVSACLISLVHVLSIVLQQRLHLRKVVVGCCSVESRALIAHAAQRL